MDEIILRRLRGLIATATNLPSVNGKYSEEARTCAIQAAFIIKNNNLLNKLTTATISNNSSSTQTKPPPTPKYSPPKPSPPPIDLEKLNFRNVLFVNNSDLIEKIVNRFIDHLKYKAKSNSYPIYSIDEILHIAITTNPNIKNSSIIKNSLRLELKSQVDYGCLDSRRGRTGGYFLKKI